MFAFSTALPLFVLALAAHAQQGPGPVIDASASPAVQAETSGRKAVLVRPCSDNNITQYPCPQQADWGKCRFSWAASACQWSCGRCVYSCPSIAEVLRSRPELSDFNEMIEAAGLPRVLNDPQTLLTVFAPTNTAIRGLVGAGPGDPKWEAFLSLPEQRQLKYLLNNHFLTDVKSYTSIPSSTGTHFPTLLAFNNAGLNGSLVRVRPGPTYVSFKVYPGGQINVQSGSATGVIVKADVWACDSVIHEVDRILLP